MLGVTCKDEKLSTESKKQNSRAKFLPSGERGYSWSTSRTQESVTFESLFRPIRDNTVQRIVFSPGRRLSAGLIVSTALGGQTATCISFLASALVLGPSRNAT
ncbi:hypothetical protein VTO42DRAFT_3001 [Malbranchea cinnamomea]